LRQHDNSFFGDPVLFQLASHLLTPLLPELAELGAYVASDEAENRARFITRHRPLLHLYDNGGQRCEEMDLHPAYHSLLTRARHAGIASSLFETEDAHAVVRHQARAIRLMLLSGVECTTSQELCLSSAAAAILHQDEKLWREWNGLLCSRIHDPLLKPYPQKQGAALSFAVNDQEGGEKTTILDVYREDQALPAVVRIHGHKSAVINPLADGFVVSALFEGRQSLFLVPRLFADGRLNGIRLLPCSAAPSCAFPCADLYFSASAGWPLGGMNEGEALLSHAYALIQFDRMVMQVGQMRRVLRLAVDKMRHEQKTGQMGAAQAAIEARILADAALDCAAATFLVLRIARAFDLAANEKTEAVLSQVALSAVGYWIECIIGQILDCCCPHLTAGRVMQGNIHERIITNLSPFYGFEKLPVQLLMDCLGLLQKHATSLDEIIARLVVDCGSVEARAGEKLRSTLLMTNEDAAAVCLFAEQFSYILAAACMSKLDMEIISSAFINSRLGGAWRSSYGLLSARFNPIFILEALYPSA